MALSHKARKRLSIVLLVVWMPVYIVLAVNVVAWIGRPPILIELLVYAVLGVAWVLPFRAIFRGIGQADPDAGEKRD